MLIIATQLLALVVAMIKSDNTLIRWDTLGFISIWMQLSVLTSAAIICLSRNKLAQFSIRTQALVCFALILSCTLGVSLLSLTLLPSDSVTTANHFIIRNMLITGLMSSLLLRYFYIEFIAQEQKQAELHARIEALQSRIRPHFLFNSMNSIASLIASHPEKAEDAVLDLSSLFRATLNTQSRFVTIKEELDLCSKYLNIEALRLGNRLKIEWHVDAEVNECLIPPLTLQPLVENAIYHGIQPIAEGGLIRLEGYCKNDMVYLLISNPFQAKVADTHGNQIALANIAARLSALYANSAILKSSQNNDTYTVTVRFPKRKA
jgi:two-component system, LytTR family, sensor histidine kinase AlgZ